LFVTDHGGNYGLVCWYASDQLIIWV